MGRIERAMTVQMIEGARGRRVSSEVRFKAGAGVSGQVGVGFEVMVCAALRVGAIAREQRGGGFILRPSDGASDVRGAER